MIDSPIRPFRSATVFGGATIDVIARSARSPVGGASNPGTIGTTPGGVGFNVACVLARLGLPARLVTRVGRDAGGETVLAAAGAAGVDTALTGTSADFATAAYHAVLDNRGGLIIGIADMAIIDEMTPELVAAATTTAAADDLWIVDANLPVTTLDYLVGEAEARGIPVAALPVSPAKAPRLGPLLDRIALLFANRKEAAVLLDAGEAVEPGPAAALADALSRRFGLQAVVTDGAGTVAAAAGGKVQPLVPLRAKVRSVNGAGDALAAGTIAALAAGRSFVDALHFGLAAAAVVAESDGTIPFDLNATTVAARVGARATAEASLS